MSEFEDDFWSGLPDEAWPLELSPLPPDPEALADPDDAAAGTLPPSSPESRCSGEQLAQLAPGVALAEALEEIEPALVDEYELVEMIAGYQRIAAWSQSQMAHLAAALSRRAVLNPPSGRPGDAAVLNVTAEELAPRLGLSRAAAKRLVDLGRGFGLKLEDTAVALHQGRIDYAKACVLLRALADQPDDVAWQVQQLVLPDASHQTITQLERAVAQAIIAADPHRATARARKARDTRRVNHPRVLPDGMASMYAVLPATDAAGLDLALEAAARSAKAAGDTRTLDQLRADALALLGHGALEQGFIGVPQTDQATDSHRPEQVGTEGSPVGAVAADAPETGGDYAPETGEDYVSGDGAHADAVRAEEPADEDAPAFGTGNAFLRTPHMPLGAIGGQRAQIHVTVPLSVLLPPELLRHPPDTDSPGDSCAHGEEKSTEGPGDRCAHGEEEPTEGPGDGCVYCQDGLPLDWYPGPIPAEVAELEGYGPITPDVARALAYGADAWFRLLTDPVSGQLLDVGRTRYRPPAGMARFVQLRDKTCVNPICPAAARRCQLDHVISWHEGGVTSADNLGPQCPRDHQVKTSGAFQVEHQGGGTFVWTTPSGHRYRRDHTGHITALSRREAGATGAVATPADNAGNGFDDEPPF